MFQALWKCVQAVYGLNRNILCDEAYFAAVRTASGSVFAKWIEPSIMRSILEEAQSQINTYSLSNKYTDLFSDASKNYLEKYRNKICSYCNDLELFNRWPFVEKENKNIVQIKASLQSKKLHGDSVKQFEDVINHKGSASICRFMKSRENERILEQVLKSESLEAYISRILKRLDSEVAVPSKNNSGRESYDELCVLLVLKFPEQKQQVFRHVMRSSYGGVWAMSSIYTLLCRNAKTYDLTRDDKIEIRECMKQEITLFFEQYKMSRTDKKSIKTEREFMRKIGLSYKDLRKL